MNLTVVLAFEAIDAEWVFVEARRQHVTPEQVIQDCLTLGLYVMQQTDDMVIKTMDDVPTLTTPPAPLVL